VSRCLDRTGVYFDESRRRWLYQPEPFDAEDCENVAAAMGDDGWARDLLAAADRIRERDAGCPTIEEQP
jgi:hypothetical protein